MKLFIYFANCYFLCVGYQEDLTSYICVIDG
jgi:hypothetical protein